MKLKNDLFICLLLSEIKGVLHKFIPDKLFMFLNWNVKHLEAAAATQYYYYYYY